MPPSKRSAVTPREAALQAGCEQVEWTVLLCPISLLFLPLGERTDFPRRFGGTKSCGCRVKRVPSGELVISLL